MTQSGWGWLREDDFGAENKWKRELEKMFRNQYQIIKKKIFSFLFYYYFKLPANSDLCWQTVQRIILKKAEHGILHSSRKKSWFCSNGFANFWTWEKKKII